MEVDESSDSVSAVGIIDGGEPIVGPASVDGGEGERERGEGRRSNSEGDWCMVVRKWVKCIDTSQRELTRDEIVETVLCPEWELTDEGEPGQ